MERMETVAIIFGMSFVGIILVCLAWTIVNYIMEEVQTPNDKLEENIKRFDKQISNDEQNR